MIFLGESVRSDYPTVTRVMSFVTYYLGKYPKAELTPRCVGGPDCLAQLEMVIRRGQFMGAEATLRWMEQAESGANPHVCFFPQFLTAGVFQDFAATNRALHEAIRQRPSGSALLVPLIFAEGQFSYKHIVCLAVSDKGLEYFDAQQAAMTCSQKRAFTCGGSLGQLLAEAWLALGESLTPVQRGAMTLVGNTETNAIQRDSWSCGVYVIGYMRERMRGRSHAEALTALAHAPLEELQRELWSDLNQPTIEERRRHSLGAWLPELEKVVRSGQARAFDEAWAMALAQGQGPEPEAGNEELVGFDLIEPVAAKPLNLELLLQALSHTQSVDCVGLCGSTAECPQEGRLEVRSREFVLHQAVQDIKRSQVIILEGRRSLSHQNDDEYAQDIALGALRYIEQKVQKCIPGGTPHMADQLLGICSQTPGAAMYGALMYMRGLLEEDDQIAPGQMQDSETGCMETHLDETGLHHRLSIPYAFKQLRDGSVEIVGEVLVTSEFSIRWEELPNLVEEGGERLNLAKVLGTLTLEPLIPTTASSAGETSTSSL